MKPLFFVISLLIFSHHCYGQDLTREQVNDTIYEMPAFSIYQDNYFISGVPLHTNVGSETADAKYQISFKQLLSRNTLPLDSYLFLTYTQTAFWNLYTFSSPFEDINFNPGIGLGRPVFNSDDRLMGMAFLKLEHESNGRDSIYSRSWNSLSGIFHSSINDKIAIRARAWLPFFYKKDNPDLLEYIGVGEVELSYDIKPEKIGLDIMFRKGTNWEWKGAVRTRFMYRPFKMRSHYLMLEWFHGYGESLIDYNNFKSMIRIGFVIKSDELNFVRPSPTYFN